MTNATGDDNDVQCMQSTRIDNKKMENNECYVASLRNAIQLADENK